MARKERADTQAGPAAPQAERAMRRSERERRTAETIVRLTLDLDRAEAPRVETPVCFLSHLLEQLGLHGGFCLGVVASYTGAPLAHHLVEDVGIVLGQAIDEALGPREGIVRFGSAVVPMDESLIGVALDLSGRGGFYGPAGFSAATADGYETANVLEFFRALAANARLTLHLEVRRAGNAHHEIEAAHKALAVALRQALALRPEAHDAVSSTKGVL